MMKIESIERTLRKLEELIQSKRYEQIETDVLELKPVPANGGEWREIQKTACAFLNTRGGIILLGITETDSGGVPRLEFTGWKPHAEPNVKEIQRQFKDELGNAIPNLSDAFPEPMIREFLTGHIAIVLVDELPADQKFAFLGGEAFHRVLTGDHKLKQDELERQREFREEALQARELRPVPGMLLSDLDIDKLNEYITQLNKPQRIETIKADLQSAASFLKRKSFLVGDTVTTLGALVCGQHPGDRLGFRCQVHGYVDAVQAIAQDKQDLVDNILSLMERSFAYVLRNIQVGVSASEGGRSNYQYPEELLRETINLSHQTRRAHFNSKSRHISASIDYRICRCFAAGPSCATRGKGAQSKAC
jgi:ATP-dependent DNA helicase RecG